MGLGVHRHVLNRIDISTSFAESLWASRTTGRKVLRVQEPTRNIDHQVACHSGNAMNLLWRTECTGQTASPTQVDLEMKHRRRFEPHRTRRVIVTVCAVKLIA